MTATPDGDKSELDQQEEFDFEKLRIDFDFEELDGEFANISPKDFDYDSLNPVPKNE